MNKKIKKIILLPFIMLFLLLNNIQPVNASNKIYAWYVVFDEVNHTLIGYTVEDSVKGFRQKVEESYSTGADVGGNHVVMKNGIEGITTSKVNIDLKKSEAQVVSADGRKYLAWEWPPDISIDASAEDAAMAEWVNQTLIDSFNTASQKVISENNLTFKNNAQYFKLIYQISESAYSPGKGQSITIINDRGKNQKVSWNTAAVDNKELKENGINITEPGMGASDYVKIYTKNESNSVIIPFQVPKGYSKGQRLYEKYKDAKDLNLSRKPSKIGWSHMVYQAAYSDIVKNIDSTHTDEIFNPSSIDKWLNGMVGSLLNGITSFIGLYSIEEMTLNQGLRGVTYYRGLMPRGWFNGANILFWFCMIISLFILAISFIKLLIRRNTSIINPGDRVELMDGFMKIIYSAIMLILFVPGFALLALLNEIVVSVLSALTGESAALSVMLGNNTLVGIIIQFAFLFILFKVNITYIVRAITIALLYSFGPLFISMMAMGEKGKQRFDIWVKELLSNVLLQSFHAAITAFYKVGLKYQSLKIIERFVLTMTYIPLTDFFRNTLMDLQSGTDGANKLASNAFGTMGGSALAGLIGGASGLLFNRNKNGKDDKKNSRNDEVSSEDEVTTSERTTFNSQQAAQKAISRTERAELRSSIGNNRSLSAAKDSILNAKNKAVDNLTNNKYGAASVGGARVMGKLAKPIPKALKMSALAGTTLGMDAIGANSFEGRRRLANATADMGNSIYNIPNDIKEGLDYTYADYCDGDPSLEERTVSQSQLNKLGYDNVSMRRFNAKSLKYFDDDGEGNLPEYDDDMNAYRYELSPSDNSYKLLNGPHSETAKQLISQNIKQTMSKRYDMDNVKVAFGYTKHGNEKVYDKLMYTVGDNSKLYGINVNGKKAYNVTGEPFYDIHTAATEISSNRNKFIESKKK